MSKRRVIKSPVIERKVESPSLTNRFEANTFLQISALVFLPFFLYIKTTGFEFIKYDDVVIITDNKEIIGNIRNIGKAFNTDAFVSTHGLYYRPLQTVSFMLDAFMGGVNPWVFHFSNIIYHILTVLSFFYFLTLLQLRRMTAFFAALVFSVHPLLCSAVSWVPARGDIFIALFGILLFINFHLYLEKGRLIYYLLHGLFFMLALFSKETAMLFPLLLLFYSYFVLKKRLIETRVIALTALWIPAIVIFYFLRQRVVTEKLPDFILGLKPFFMNIPAIPIAVAKMFIPADLSPMPLFQPMYTVIGSVILILIVVLVIKAFIKLDWVILFGFAWLMVFLLPPMFFRLLYSNFLIEYYEHRLYLPVIGMLIMLASWTEKLAFIESRKKFAVGVLLVIISLFIYQSFMHSGHFKDSYAFFGRAAELGNPGAFTKRGELYSEEKDYDASMSDFNEAIDISGGEYPLPFLGTASIESGQMNNHKAAEDDYTRVIALNPSITRAYIMRSVERKYLQNYEGAFSDLNKAQEQEPSNPDIYYRFGNLYFSQKKYQESVLNFTKAIELKKNFPQAFNNRATVYYNIHDLPKAESDYRKAIELKPDYLSAYLSLGSLYIELNKPEAAIACYDHSIAISPEQVSAYEKKGFAYIMKNEIDNACAAWQQGINRGKSSLADSIRKYCH